MIPKSTLYPDFLSVNLHFTLTFFQRPLCPDQYAYCVVRSFLSDVSSSQVARSLLRWSRSCSPGFLAWPVWRCYSKRKICTCSGWCWWFLEGHHELNVISGWKPKLFGAGDGDSYAATFLNVSPWSPWPCGAACLRQLCRVALWSRGIDAGAASSDGGPAPRWMPWMDFQPQLYEVSLWPRKACVACWCWKGSEFIIPIDVIWVFIWLASILGQRPRTSHAVCSRYAGGFLA
jgi:hypothetical protein